MRVYIVGSGGIGLFIQYCLQPHLEALLIARDVSRTALAHTTGIVEGKLDLGWNDLARVEQLATVSVAVKRSNRSAQQAQCGKQLLENGISTR